VVTDLAPDLWPAAVDPGDLEDAILNLAINARDAMPEGGVLTIRAGNLRIDKRHVLMNPDAREGDHLAIEVSDTGIGMAPAVMERVFEPFFTTKDKDRGTGLGLAMVYGFVKRSGGHITVNSHVGAGSTFQIYLPRALEGAAQDDAPAAAEQFAPGAETLLVVDDEEALLDAAGHQLRELGYRTLTARNGAEALGIIAERDDIDLLFSDVIMPGSLDGYGLAREARRLRPELKILLTSGFTGAREATRHIEDSLERQLTKGLLAKPYTTETLASAIRGALGSAVPRAAAGGKG
jgi:CheY-like chemotaxis protein